MFESVAKCYIGGGIYNIANINSNIDFSSIISHNSTDSAVSPDAVASV